MYRLYLIDFDGQYIELDTEELDFGLDFKISSLSDLSFRSGNRTKEVTLKGTEANNNAFGYIYRLGRSSNIDLDNKLFFNYNSLRQVDCLVYRDTNLLFRGTLRLIETVVIKGVFYYKVVLTDTVIDVMKYTQDKFLTDIDFTYLKHQYTIDTITQSWANQTQRWDGTTFSYTPYEKGSGYVYGYAYYGLTPSPSLLEDSIYNYRPSVYVKEIFNGIFGQTGLGGITWELKGDDLFTDKFNSLVIPNSQENFSTSVSNISDRVYRCSGPFADNQVTYFVRTNNTTYLDLYNPHRLALLTTNCKTVTGSNPNISILQLMGTYSSVHNVLTTINCDAMLSFSISLSVDPALEVLHTQLQIVERDMSSGVNPVDSNWQVIAYKEIIFQLDSYPSGNINDSGQVYIPKRLWNSTKQIAVRAQVWYEDEFLTPTTTAPTIVNATASFTIPHLSTNTFDIDVRYGMELVPQLAPGGNVKQYDFIKSIMLMFNLFCYTEKERPKHLIFQNYDDFYSLTTIDNLKYTALDWSSKIIYSEDRKKSENLSIPKRYIYTYKEDKDYLNTDYKNVTNQIYGQLKFSDEYGITDESKIEILFSPSPMVILNNDIFCTMIRGGDISTLKSISSNIRVLSYNGYKNRSDYSYTYGTYSLPTITGYGEMCEYYREDAGQTYLDVQSNYFSASLQYGNPVKYYFPADGSYANLPNLYSTYYINRVSELTNSNLHTIECKMILNNVDIATFDFRVPIYISTDMGNSYYKVLEISWKDEKTPATVRLQSINISKV